MTDFLAVLLCLVLNYPILLDEGYVLPKFLTLIVEEKSTWYAMEKRFQGHLMTLTSYGSLNKTREIFTFANSCGIAMEIRKRTAVPSKRYEESMALFSDILFRHSVGAYPTAAVPLLLSVGSLPEDADNNTFCLFLDEGKKINVGVEDLIPSGKELTLVKEQWKTITGYSNVGQILAYATCFSYPALSKTGRLEEYYSLMEAVQRVEQMNENARSRDGIVEQFLEGFWSYVSSHHHIVPIDLSTAPALLPDPDICFFFKNGTVSVTPVLFAAIVASMRLSGVLPDQLIKQFLKEEGVLLTDETGTYQTKIRFPNKCKEAPLRGYRFSVEQLERDTRDRGVRLRAYLKGLADSER